MLGAIKGQKRKNGQLPFGQAPSDASDSGTLLTTATDSGQADAEQSIGPTREMRREQIAILLSATRTKVAQTTDLEGRGVSTLAVQPLVTPKQRRATGPAAQQIKRLMNSCGPPALGRSYGSPFFTSFLEKVFLTASALSSTPPCSTSLAVVCFLRRSARVSRHRRTKAMRVIVS